MFDPVAVVAIFLSALSLGSMVVLFRYLPTLRRSASSYQESSSVISHILGELNSRASLQDKRLIDVQVKLDVLEERWMRSGWAPSEAAVAYTRMTDRYLAAHKDRFFEPGMRRQDRAGEFVGETSQSSMGSRKLSKVELIVLENLLERHLTAPEVKGILGSSREHAARVMKLLTDRGLVLRDLTKKPYTYEISDSGRDVVTSHRTG